MLSSECETDYQCISLVVVLLDLGDADEGTFALAREVLARADPNANRSSFLRSGFVLARECGAPCLPVVARLLAMEPFTYRVGDLPFAFTVDRSLQLAWGQYGNAAAGFVRPALADDACTVRRNGVSTVGILCATARSTPQPISCASRTKIARDRPARPAPRAPAERLVSTPFCVHTSDTMPEGRLFP